MASHKDEGERREPALDDMEPGRIYGAVIPMSEGARTQMRDSMEVIDTSSIENELSGPRIRHAPVPH